MPQQRPVDIDELMKKYAQPQQLPPEANPSAQTYPEGALPGPGLTTETAQSPALASGSNGQANAAPATAQPKGPQAGAGGTSARDHIMNADPQMRVDVAEQAAKAVSSKSGETSKLEGGGAQQKAEINKALAAQGADPKESFEALYQQELETLEKRHKAGEITKRQYKGWKNRWKNIFNVVPEEDFGLFLMDFGLRMMTASGQGEAFGTSFGMAGQGALAGSQARQQQKQQLGMGREQQAFDRALARSGLEKARDSQVESTQAGLIERGPDGEWRPIVNPETDKPYQRQYAGMEGYKGEKAWLYDFGKRIGKSEEEIFDIINGAMPEQQRRDRYEELVLKMIKDASFTDSDPVLGKKYRDFNAKDIEAWIQQMMGQRRGALQ